ncbi:Ig-like domain-containing protein [Clostridium estertheticum]|uniref:Ig-like domain-containing protein n=1 Tax=Clostridium estertheticum TaxID=238834 RepID=UPI001C6F1C30|nr:Ig-like domain-containing protein [Clostridium estertheticum]MBW9173593.1 Ig-like domain-containing protein [Clostridium estertheticum]WLC75226.1 Ig-like domain-containing protein [Clostridium estertheticum]
MKLSYKVIMSAAIAIGLSSISMITTQAATGDFYNQTTQTRYLKEDLIYDTTLAAKLEDQMSAGNVILKEYNTGKYVNYDKANTFFISAITSGVETGTAMVQAIAAGATDATEVLLDTYPQAIIELAVKSVVATNATTVNVKLNRLLSDADKSGLTYSFNGAIVPASNVTYSGITATLTGLTLVNSVDGKTPAYEVIVNKGDTQLFKRSIVWNKTILANSLISKVMAISDVSIILNGTPVLPSIINVVYKDGTSGREYVTWASVVTSAVGVKKVTGKINGSTITASINVNVTPVEYINNITLQFYPTLGIYKVNVKADDSAVRITLNNFDMYYMGNDSFQLSTLLTIGSTVTFNVYNTANKLIGTKKYVVPQ